MFVFSDSTARVFTTNGLRTASEDHIKVSPNSVAYCINNYVFTFFIFQNFLSRVEEYQ